MPEYEKLILITRRTRLEELLIRFNTRAQARFYLERAGGDFAAYEAEDAAYRRALETVREALDCGLPVQVMDRSLVPTYLFTARDAIVTLGPDGLVANAAKYTAGQPLVAVNPDPERIDGVLARFAPRAVRGAVERVLAGRARSRRVTLAEARLADGQRLLAFNDLFVGAASHVSARYRIRHGGREEAQSSSGILISTGAGSTGWLSSVFAAGAGLARFLGSAAEWEPVRLDWETARLVYVVREPFSSRTTGVGMVAGYIDAGAPLEIASQMPAGGVIFSDGMEEDRLPFLSGAVASIGIAPEQAILVVP